MTRSESINQATPILSSRGVYIIRNIVNGMKYVGSTRHTFFYRFGQHLKDLELRRHHNFLLQRDYNNVGMSGFELDVLEECDASACVEREQFWINELKPEYNIRNNQKSGAPLGYRIRIREKMNLR